MNKSCQRCGNIKVMGERDIKKRKKEKKIAKNAMQCKSVMFSGAKEM